MWLPAMMFQLFYLILDLPILLYTLFVQTPNWICSLLLFYIIRFYILTHMIIPSFIHHYLLYLTLSFWFQFLPMIFLPGGFCGLQNLFISIVLNMSLVFLHFQTILWVRTESWVGNEFYSGVQRHIPSPPS